MERPAQITPPAFTAVEAYPALHAMVEPNLRRQAGMISAALARFQERPRLLATLAAALHSPHGGLVSLEGPPGSGVTSLLAALATRLLLPLWLAPVGSPAALYAQLVAIHRPGLPLLDPAVATDPAALERLLGEAVASRSAGQPVALAIDDLDPPGQPICAGPPPLPASLPRGVTLLLGCAPGAPLPYPPYLRLRLPDDDPDVREAQARALARLRCPRRWSGPLIDGANGSFLYLRQALAMLREGLADPAALPHGLDALLRAWWDGLPPEERRLAAILAAAGEPIPLAVAASLTAADPRPTLLRWARLGLVTLARPAPPAAAESQPEGPASLAPVGAFAHQAQASLVAQVAAPDLAAAHADLAGLALRGAEQEAARTSLRQGQGSLDAGRQYLRRQLARHAALAPREFRDQALPNLAGREWMRAYERHGELAAALEEARWELRAAAGDGTEIRLIRAAALAGILASRSRTLTPDCASEALAIGIEQSGREPTLRRVLDIVERLPDSLEKAVVLRRLGEVCYTSRMRSSAMRLLSRALDLEASPVSRAWLDAREGLYAALAGAALAQGASDTALAIAGRIEHLERRAMVETMVVRHLLATGRRSQAQRLARAIIHESMGAWARAEVAVALTRAGDARGAMLLEEIQLETVSSWAQIELACDEAATDEAAAIRRIEALPTQGQRDRGLARLARALAVAGNDGAALAAAEQITAVEVRVAALIDLRLTLEGLVAMLALERATRDISAVAGEHRAPLIGDLAAALAALGRSDRAMELASDLPEGEERDRAQARIAVAMAQRGEHEAAQDLIERVGDEDEQAWAYDEFARLLAAAGRWDEAISLCGRISAADRRARASADLAIERGRSANPDAALAMALAIDPPAERARALTMLAPRLVTLGDQSQAIAVAGHPDALDSAEARERYLAAVGAALAEHGRTEAAAAIVVGIRQPGARARAGVALAYALAPQSPEAARAVLGAALRAAAVGREEALRALELAAPTIARLGGAPLLEAAAATVDEIDSW